MKTVRKILKWLFGIIIFLILTVVILVRFTDGSINNSDKILLGYDEEKGRFQIWEKKTFNLNGIDGPYIIDNQLYEVTKENKLLNRNIDIKEKLIVKVDNSDNDQFTFQLKDSITSEPDFYELPEKLIVISDIEGNFDGFLSFLINNGVIDKNFNWTFGNGHLLLNGDFVDRGENVTQVLWLIYKLEQEALNQNGKVHYILGNHEIMNFQGNAHYANKKYKRVAQLISKNDSLKIATQFLYSDKTELGKWLRSKNIIEKIGKYIFVHAGISPEIIKYNVSLSDINQIARNNWDKNLYDEEENNKVENFITGRKGIYWYRGLAQDYKYYDKIKENELKEVLNFYQADKIVFGHSVMEDITTEFNGKTINTDVKHGQKKNSGKTKGLLIENGIEYKIDGKGEKTKL
ncbi:MAG: metallophosphoesterase [Chitinophagales bacterium]|nr:metallophosphoesterase [Chitinophagales bacterium]